MKGTNATAVEWHVLILRCLSVLKALPVFEELSLSDLRHLNSNAATTSSSDAEDILSNLRALREQIVTAWSERGVVLSRPEQAALHAEIKETCEFLTALTRHA